MLKINFLAGRVTRGFEIGLRCRGRLATVRILKAAVVFRALPLRPTDLFPTLRRRLRLDWQEFRPRTRTAQATRMACRPTEQSRALNGPTCWLRIQVVAKPIELPGR